MKERIVIRFLRLKKALWYFAALNLLNVNYLKLNPAGRFHKINHFEMYDSMEDVALFSFKDMVHTVWSFLHTFIFLIRMLVLTQLLYFLNFPFNLKNFSLSQDLFFNVYGQACLILHFTSYSIPVKLDFQFFFLLLL